MNNRKLDKDDAWITGSNGKVVGVQISRNSAPSILVGSDGNITQVWKGTQAEYDAIAVKDDATLYVIV